MGDNIPHPYDGVLAGSHAGGNASKQRDCTIGDREGLAELPRTKGQKESEGVLYVQVSMAKTSGNSTYSKHGPYEYSRLLFVSAREC